MQLGGKYAPSCDVLACVGLERFDFVMALGHRSSDLVPEEGWHLADTPGQRHMLQGVSEVHCAHTLLLQSPSRQSV